MKKIFVILILSAAAEVTWSQNHTLLDSAILECRYLESTMIDTLSRRVFQDTMTLLVGKNHTLFYSKKLVFRDSLYQLPGGKQQFIQLLNRYLREGRREVLSYNTTEYLYQDLMQGKFTVLATVDGVDRVEFIEEREAPEWVYRDSVKTVMGFECHLAEVDFRGRRWQAWYTLEVPVSLGPWKLWGLPGLICEAYDESRQYEYSLVALKPTAATEIWLYRWSKEYKKTSRIDFLRAKKAIGK